MPVRGIRGAVAASENQPEAILSATSDLLKALMTANPTLSPADIASVIFTVTDDLSTAYPAQAARELGWKAIPLLCTREIPVPAGLARCIRVLVHWNTDLPQEAIRHVYLGEAVSLRPDLDTSSG
jgi:chorismate mutase